MNSTALGLTLLIAFGLFHFNVTTSPLVFTFLAVLLMVHITNHTWVAKTIEKPKH